MNKSVEILKKEKEEKEMDFSRVLGDLKHELHLKNESLVEKDNLYHEMKILAEENTKKLQAQYENMETKLKLDIKGLEDQNLHLNNIIKEKEDSYIQSKNASEAQMNQLIQNLELIFR